MTTAAQEQQLMLDLQNELVTTNQLLNLIGNELQMIKAFTKSDSDFVANIKQNADLIEKLGKVQQVDLQNLPPMKRITMNTSNVVNQNVSYQEHDSFRNSMNDSE